MLRFCFTCILIAISYQISLGQNVPLGHWQTHLPFENARSVALSKNNLYATSEYAVFSYNLQDGSIKKFTKSEGLSDVGVSTIGYDTLTSTLIIAYNNSNIDIIQNGKVINIPYLLKANILGNKQINHIYTHQGIAWLATGFGIVELRLEKQEIGDSYFFSDGTNNFKVNQVWGNDQYIFAASAKGLYKGVRDVQTNLVNFQNWELLSSEMGLPVQEYTAISGRNDEIFVATGASVYIVEENMATPYYNMPSSKIFSLFKSKERLWVTQENRISMIPDNGTPQNISGKFDIAYPLQIVESEDGRVFYADLYRTTYEYLSENNQSAITPNGPRRVTSKGIDFLNDVAYIGSSPINALFHPTFNATGFYASKDYFWETFHSGNLSDISGSYDICLVEALPAENMVLLGAHNTGIIEFFPETKKVNFIRSFPNSTSNLRVTAAEKDIYNNIWITNAYSNQPLICRKPGGEYVIFSSPLINNKLINGIAIDNFQQIWLSITDGGVVVLNYGTTLDDKTDDQYISYTTAPGAGGLPTNSVTSIASDMNGQIWIGSIQGVAQVPCPGSVFERNCDAIQICVPRNDGTNFCDLLLETETINSIVVDAANRKWFGTNNGIFLKSEDGFENIHYFSEENSPLLSNRIRSLGIHPTSGDLYILTENGIITYRSDATLTSTNDDTPYAYPNPVRPDYHGSIAVKNLPENSTVKITDAAGRLVIDGTANGSTFVWDGNDIHGKRVSTGVYFVLATNQDKSSKVATKIAFVK